MAKVIKRTDYRIIVRPQALGYFGYGTDPDSTIEPDKDKCLALYKKACEDIIAGIMKHVDGLGDVILKCDTEEVCSFCENRWELEMEGSDIGCPVCCDEAIAEWEKETGRHGLV